MMIEEVKKLKGDKRRNPLFFILYQRKGGFLPDSSGASDWPAGRQSGR
jgi:hypothetical protein